LVKPVLTLSLRSTLQQRDRPEQRIACTAEPVESFQPVPRVEPHEPLDAGMTNVLANWKN
jgi:hypothetical protein